MIMNQNSVPGLRGLCTHLLALMSCLLIGPVSGDMSQPIGESLEIPCKASIGFSDSFSTMIYWLANQRFIEDKFTDMRVSESDVIFHTKNGQNFIKKNLIFTQIKPEDFHTNFTCIVMNPVGVSVHTLHLSEDLEQSLGLIREKNPETIRTR